MGVRLSCCGSIEGHIKDRAKKAKVAMSKIKKPQLLSIDTALTIFNICVAPVATYGTEVVWEQMTIRLCMLMESVKATFLKRCLGVARGTRNRDVYSWLGVNSFVEEMVVRYNLSWTSAALKYIQGFRDKINEVSRRGPFWGSFLNPR